MNRAERRRMGVQSPIEDRLAKLGLVQPQDPALTRVKYAAFPIGFLVELLQSNGPKIFETKGWPEGAMCIGASGRMVQTADGPQAQMVFTLTHPDFPVNLGAEPSELTVEGQLAKAVLKEDADGPDPEDG